MNDLSTELVEPSRQFAFDVDTGAADERSAEGTLDLLTELSEMLWNYLLAYGYDDERGGF